MSPQDTVVEKDEEAHLATKQDSFRSTSTKKSHLISTREVPLIELELENVTYAPITSTAKAGGNSDKKRKVILDNISTKISPYQLTAWMGPSGSGKTSLISVAAGLTNHGDISESSVIKINGEEGKIPKRLVGVVWQDDLLLSNLTVEETIYFAAKLKTPAGTPDSEVRTVVEETMEELGLLHIRESLVGNSTAANGVRGISGGERKRVSVASELVVRPSLLFLDEPTSGLDATSAQALMQTLNDLAKLGHTIAVVIHQPRTTIFGMVDNLLLLSHGHTVYNGKACHARSHLESCPSVQPLPPETGIADWLMDVIKEDEAKATPTLPTFWTDAPHKPLSAACGGPTITTSPIISRRMSSLAELHAIPKYETSFWTQLSILSTRTLKQQRGEKLTRVSMLLTLLYIFFTGVFWWRLEDDTNRVYDRNSLLFFMLIAQSNGIVVSSMTVFQRERALLTRERAKKMYGVLPYFLAKTASDMTNNVLMPCAYGIVTYWMANLRPEASAFFKFVLAFYLTLSTAQSMGLLLSITIPNMQVALILAPPITLFFIIMAGFYIPLQNMSVALRWVSWLSFARYGYSSFLINEYQGRDIPCAEGEVAVSIGGSECPLPGEEVYNSLGIEGVATNFWFNIGIVVALQVFLRTASYAMLRRSK